MPRATKQSASPGTAGPAKGPLALLIGTRKGAFILRGNKSREQWKLSQGMFVGNIIHHIVLDPRDQKTMLLCARTGHLGPTIFRSTDYGKTWKEAAKPPAFPKAPEGQKGRVLDHNFWLTPGHAREEGVWYVGTSPQGLFRTEDHGVTWEEVKGFNNHPLRQVWAGPDEEGPPDGAILHSIEIDPRDPRHMYISLSGGGFFESRDRGADWAPLCKGLVSDFLPVPDAEYGHDPHCTRMHPMEPDRLYMQSHCGLYRMDRPKGKWVRIGENLPKENDISDYSFPVVLHPRDPDTVWALPLDGGFPLGRVTPNGKPATYITRDGGKKWKRQDKGFPKKDGWFSVKRQGMTADHHAPVGVYFGTTGGEVWASLDEGNHWGRIAEHLPEIYSVEVAQL